MAHDGLGRYYCNRNRINLVAMMDSEYKAAMVSIFEKHRLAASNKMSGFVARDNDGTLTFYTEKPRRIEKCRFFMRVSGDTLELPKEMFGNLLYEDEPIEVELQFTEK